MSGRLGSVVAGDRDRPRATSHRTRRGVPEELTGTHLVHAVTRGVAVQIIAVGLNDEIAEVGGHGFSPVQLRVAQSGCYLIPRGWRFHDGHGSTGPRSYTAVVGGCRRLESRHDPSCHASRWPYMGSR